MTGRQNISVSLTPEQARFLDACVDSGRYQTVSEAVREGVRLLQDRIERHELEVERLRALIREGAEQLDRGEHVDLETFLQEWDERLDAIDSAQRLRPE